jgi:RimJ/RimL family protein N-acetyltransferase
MVRLEKFDRMHFHNLISWIDSEETLVQIAGRQMTFPVTEEQLDVSQADKNRHAFSILNLETGEPIGHCELYLLEDSAKIDRLIIGDPSMKGKGLCAEIIKLLLAYGFDVLNQSKIELNVFDWNTAAIRCYEKSGFSNNSHKTTQFEINGKMWLALNMSIDKATYEQIKN